MNKVLYNENLPRNRYTSRAYNHGARWMSYFHQLRLLSQPGITSVLEVGPGHGWMARVLADMDIMVKTVDINPDLAPDYFGSLDHLPLEDNSFDAVCAFEVLEHMPFDLFVSNLKEMARVARKYVIISLPDQRRTLVNLSLKVPLLPLLSWFIKVPTFREHKFDGRHYWEIGKRGYSPSRVKEEISKSGLQLIRSFVPADAPTNHYFVMEKLLKGE